MAGSALALCLGMKNIILFVAVCIFSYSTWAQHLVVSEAFQGAGPEEAVVVIRKEMTQDEVKALLLEKEIELVGGAERPFRASVVQVEKSSSGLADAVGGTKLTLRGIDKKDIRRGMVIARPGTITPIDELSVSVDVKDFKGDLQSEKNPISLFVRIHGVDVPATGVLYRWQAQGIGHTVVLKLLLAVPVAYDENTDITLLNKFKQDFGQVQAIKK